MDRNELQKLIQGTVVTTPTPMDKDMKVDYARITEVTRWWVEQGLGTNVAPLKVCAAGGEGPALTDSEWEQVIRTTVNAAGPDAVIMCALKAKSTYHTIEDAKRHRISGLSASKSICRSPTIRTRMITSGSSLMSPMR